jgi:hypothetical protein
MQVLYWKCRRVSTDRQHAAAGAKAGNRLQATGRVCRNIDRGRVQKQGFSRSREARKVSA